MPIKTGTMRDIVDPVTNTINLLESGQPLPDDDPRSRNGGLKPNREKDLGQIEAYIKLRQSGQISDTAWQRLMQRNPSSAVLFSQIQSPQQPYKGFFAPGKPGTPDKPYTEQDIGSGVGPFQIGSQIPGTGTSATPAKFDYEGAMATALGRGDSNMVNTLLTSKGGGKESPFGKINPKEYTADSIRAFARTGDYASLVPTEGKADANTTFTQEGALRDDFTKLSKTFLDVRDAYSRVKVSAKNPSAAGDLALVFNYMKMLDPGSTVREGEFATAQNSAGIPDRVRAMYNKSVSGERLADTTRNDFVTRSSMLYERQLKNHKKLEDQFKGLAKKYSLNKERIVPDYTSDDTETPANSPSGSMPPGWTVKQK